MVSAVMSDPGALLPVVLGGPGDVGMGDVAVALPSPEIAGHLVGCLCCRPRSPLGRELARLFSARARGEVAFFRRVVALAPAGMAPNVAAAELARQIAADPVAAARFVTMPLAENASPPHAAAMESPV